MDIPHIAPAQVGRKAYAWTQPARAMLDNHVTKALGTFLLLVVLGMLIGQFLGHLLATGIEDVLDVLAGDRAS